MPHFTYKNGILHAEDVPVADIIAAIGTPTYIYSSAVLRENFTTFKAAFGDSDTLVCFSVKANSNVAVLRLLGGLGAGMDIVSGGEYARAVKAGIARDKIIFSGVGKSKEEIARALKGGIRQFNAESIPELDVINAVGKALDIVANVALRINPDIDAHTLDKISTGRKGDKFGIAIGAADAAYAHAASLSHITPVGIGMHIGSQISSTSPYRKALKKMADLVKTLRANGHKDISRLDIGGGIGIDYETGAQLTSFTPMDLKKIVKEELGALGCTIELEPGRFICANAGILATKILYVKEGADRQFLILDSAMNDLFRPALYGAYQKIIPLKEAAPDAAKTDYDIVGPVCESTDCFAHSRPMPTCKPGDGLAILSAGAYGATMASEYNSRPLVPEVLVDDDRFALIRARPTVEDMVARDILPDWLQK